HQRPLRRAKTHVRHIADAFHTAPRLQPLLIVEVIRATSTRRPSPSLISSHERLANRNAAVTTAERRVDIRTIKVRWGADFLSGSPGTSITLTVGIDFTSSMRAVSYSSESRSKTVSCIRTFRYKFAQRTP